ncbi:hypothetical protein A2U01_0059103, partial [Trifolium medium]|nr:hypothetical protein [Trifolium medium]
VVRFNMENDDGSRGWSGDIRAIGRRSGGRLISRWLKEEGGSSEAAVGGGRDDQPAVQQES